MQRNILIKFKSKIIIRNMKESTEIEKQDGKNSGRKRDILTEKENKDRKRKEGR